MTTMLILIINICVQPTSALNHFSIMILEGSGVMNLNPSSSLLHQQPAWTDSYPTCNVSSGFFGGQWHEIHPQYWTKYQVWEWLQHLLDTNQLDASCIPFQEFDINGEHLCSMSLQEFTRAAGTAGQLLYSSLQHLKWNGQCSSDLFQSTHNVIVKTEQNDPSIMNT
uniref:ETS homologous factor n=1 Tax=Cavia porcellus TaxID=10141 RepID=A0A286XUF2_CAVPO